MLIMSMNIFFAHSELESPYYLGGKMGMSQFRNVSNSEFLHLEKDKQNNFALGVFAGYQANDDFALEIGYDWLGDKKYYNDNNQRLGDLNVQGVSLSSKLGFSLNRFSDALNIYLYGKGGLFFSHSKWSGAEETSSKFNVTPLFALGIDYPFNDYLLTRIEYQLTKISYDNSVGDMDNHLITLGLIYHFNSEQNKIKCGEAKCKPVICPPLEEKVQNKQNEPIIYPLVERTYELTSDILFDFDKYNLTVLGQEVVQKLALELNRSDLVDKQVVIIGHTDTIGSQYYNLKLSIKRANTVKNELINKGVVAEQFIAYGVGMSMPVTGDKCVGLRGKQRKACLLPDRRVTIEIRAKYSKN